MAVPFVSCGAPAPSPSPTSDPTFVRSGTLKMGYDLIYYESGNRPDDVHDYGLDPTGDFVQEGLYRCCLLRTLMSYNGLSVRDGGAVPRPDLAADWPLISADGLTWTFTLKQELTYAPPFADTPIVARDFIRALERALRPDPLISDGDAAPFGWKAGYFSEVIEGAADYSAGTVSSISGVEAPDDTTIVFHLLRPTGDLSARLALAAAAPLPQGAAEGHDAGYGRHLVASGPYMIEGSEQLQPGLPAAQQPPVSGYVPGTSLTLVRNPSWRDDDLRLALVDRIEITQVADYEAALNALEEGSLDLVLGFSLTQPEVERWRSDTTLASRLHMEDVSVAFWIQMNIAAPPFDDIHVRRAVNLAVDKQALLAGMPYNPPRVLTHAVPDAFESGLLAEYDPFATDGHAGSVERAQAEMAQSRYDSDADGVCDDPACAAMRVPVWNADWVDDGRLFAQQLAPLGLEVAIEEAEDPDQYMADLGNPAVHYQLIFGMGWGADYLSAAGWFEPLATSSAIATDNRMNLSLIGARPEQLTAYGYELLDVPSLDAKIAACAAEAGAAQYECWAETDQYLMERITPWVPLWVAQNAIPTSPRVANFSWDSSTGSPALDRISVGGAP